MTDFRFHNRITLGGVMTWRDVAARLGFDNPGPILAYPPNVEMFQSSEDPDADVASGREVLIPFKKASLDRMIKAARASINETNASAGKLAGMLKANGEAISKVFAQADIANVLCGAIAGIGLTAAAASKSATAPITVSEAAAEAEMITLLKDGVAPRASNFITTITPAPEQGVGNYFRLIVRHTLGPWNPSFWASVIVAIQEEDADIYIYGIDTFTSKQLKRIASQAKSEVSKLEQQIKEMLAQRNASFYNARM